MDLAGPRIFGFCCHQATDVDSLPRDYDFRS
jgi:hypothetical protein